MGRKRTKIEKVSECIVFAIENNPTLAMKFAEYHIKNWNDMPCFRGGGLHGQDYFCTFFREAEKKIEIFIKNNEKDSYNVNRVCDFRNYKLE